MSRGYPDRGEAERLLREAECRNPGPWGDHSRVAARCAERIAAAAGMDREKAYVLGLLHDIGRKFGIYHMPHIYNGYQYMISLGYYAVARVCLSHSFSTQDFRTYIGKFDVSEAQLHEVENWLSEMEYDDYDRLVQLCDCLAGSEGVVDMEARMLDVKRRYGSYPQEKWDNNMALRAYFEAKCGRDIYEIVR
ncbi:MAG: HD domain-containing protein [Oscillospiraceae bacterium]|nr:HD domain-containing protein [Oscillospiraceae bacterium]